MLLACYANGESSNPRCSRSRPFPTLVSSNSPFTLQAVYLTVKSFNRRWTRPLRMPHFFLDLTYPWCGQCGGVYGDTTPFGSCVLLLVQY